SVPGQGRSRADKRISPILQARRCTLLRSHPPTPTASLPSHYNTSHQTIGIRSIAEARTLKVEGNDCIPPGISPPDGIVRIASSIAVRQAAHRSIGGVRVTAERQTENGHTIREGGT